MNYSNTLPLLLTPENLASLNHPLPLRGPDYAGLQRLVPGAGQSVDWQRILQQLPCLNALQRTPQDPHYHAEGDVWTHTQMVVEAMQDLEDYRQADASRQFVLFFAALLHDIAKPATTRVDPVSGRIGQPGHSARGAVDARVLLWRSGVPFDLRESICRLIAVHQLPFYALRGNRNGDSAEFIVRKLSHEVDLIELAALAEADMRGRHCPDAAEILVDIELFRELAKEEGCYGQPRAFADAFTRQRYFNGDDVHPDYVYHCDPGSTVTVLCGLPATGKSSWIAQQCADLPCVGFDDARAALKLRHGENDGMAAHFAIDQAKAYLRRKQAFVWNATHLSRQMRSKTLDLLFAYGASVEVVYLEASEAEIMRRNRNRDTTLTNAGIERMLHRWEVVLPSEAHRVRYLIQS
ncbi:AAA family ATPase [Parachitinimonas caeni]|uniref:AAA family ATPase n=1 Tax=Parachitinimonas caeni TaxID=3031301 RepID=A0ABT7E0S4_9NEIS|nr:AAA family ATPase [Parachitinimonas caeni]MDK2125891.1 AAA family ATPase [Parachitinimonas caeni]